MRDLLITLVVFGLIPMIFMRPYVGILAWSWISYMSPHRLAWGFAYNMPFAAIIGGVTIISILFSKEEKKIPVTPVTVVLMFFIAWMCITTVFAYNHDLAMLDFKRTMKIQLMTIFLLLVMTAKDRINMLVWTIVFSLGFFGLKGGIFAVATGGSYRIWGPAGSFIEDNNALALALIMTVPLMRYLQIQVKKKWQKFGLIALMLLTIIAAISSYSRGALVALVAMGIALWWKGRKKLLFGIVGLLTTVGILMFMPGQWFDRIGTLQTYDEDESAMGRINAWYFAFNLAINEPLGGGYGAFTRSLFAIYAPDPEAFHDAHSIYFEVLGEHGFIGLALFLLLGFLSFRTATWIIKNARDHTELIWARDLAAMIQVSLIGYGVGGSFLGLAYWDLPYTLMAILVMIKVIVEKYLSNPTNEENLTNIDKSSGYVKR